MKLVFAIVHPEDAVRCGEALSAAGFASTRFGSAGGFLDRDNVTLMIGVDDSLTYRVVEVLRASCRPHQEQLVAGRPAGDGRAAEQATLSPPLDVEVGGATVFVVPVDSYDKL